MTQIKAHLKCRQRNVFRILGLLLAAITVLGHPNNGLSQSSQRAPNIIRDTEIETTFKTWMDPLIQAAGLNPDSVRLVLVESPQINAFVAGGANIFIYTGLIERSENPGEVIGVLAHELGHIAGGHLIANRAAMERASYESILGAVLGAGAAILSGDGGVAAAVITGSSSIAQRRYLAHSRVNESSADQAALRFMEEAEINPEGLISFFGKLESEELLPPDQQTEYVRTHPITRNRVEALQRGVSQSAYTGTPYRETWTHEHAMMKAKLLGFLNPGRVLWVYDDRDTSLPARYAKAIAAYRDHRQEEALRLINGLITEEPENPYFLEMKAQMLLDFGRAAESVEYYRQATALLPDAALIRTALAHALLESAQSDEAMNEAVQHLERSLREEPRSARVRRLLATAYGRMGDENRAKINLAEEAVLQDRLDYAKIQAEAVLAKAAPGSREHLQAQDILAYIEIAKDAEN